MEMEAETLSEPKQASDLFSFDISLYLFIYCINSDRRDSFIAKRRMKLTAPLSIIVLLSKYITANTVTSCSDNAKLWKITITTDDHPSETSWTLRNERGTVVASGNSYSTEDTYESTSCLTLGMTFTFSIKDEGKDGLCCIHGEGGYLMTVDGTVIKQVSGGHAFQVEEFQFEVAKTSASTGILALRNEEPYVPLILEDEEVVKTITGSSAFADEDPNLQLMFEDSSISSITEEELLISDDWTNFDYTHPKFCGPKIVGGYDIAVSLCSPSTLCGFSSKQNQYGSSGNDCPKGLMCYADISCMNGPGPYNVPEETVSHEATETLNEPSALGKFTTDSTEKNVISLDESNTDSLDISSDTGKSNNSDSTEAKEYEENGNTDKVVTVAEAKHIMTITRGSYCGISYVEALSTCAPSLHCSSDDDCILPESCYSDISCTHSEDLMEENAIVSSMMEDVSSSWRRNTSLIHSLLGLSLISVWQFVLQI